MHSSRFSPCYFRLPLLAGALVVWLSCHAGVQAQTSAGSLDAGFAVGDVAGRSITTIAQQNDGKVLFGGIRFTSLNNVPVSSFTRVNADGSLDTSFKQPIIESYDTRTDDIITTLQPTTIYQPVVRVILPQADGKIVVGGNFYFVNGTAGIGGLLRFNADGSVDSTFKAPRFAGTVNAIGVNSSGQYLIGGDFTAVGADAKSGLVRLNANGKLDTDFNAGTLSGVLRSGPVADTLPSVRALVVQANGKVVIGGIFSTVGGKNVPGLARLNTDGSVDGSFAVDSRFNPTGTSGNSLVGIYALALQADGKVLAGGELLDPNPDNPASPSELNALFRFNTNGSFDASFNPGGTGTNSVVDTIVLQPDGKILIGGFFDLYNGALRNSYARLLADGTLDASFDSSSGANDEVFTLALQGDGKLLMGGFFTAVDGVPLTSVARVNADAGVAPDVTVSVNVSNGRALSEPPVTKGVFLFSRSGGNLTAPLSVPYTLSGSAQTGIDYKLGGTMPGTVDFFSTTGAVTIPANSTTATLKIKPLSGSVPVRKRIVVLALTAPTNVLNVAGSTAKVKIVNTSVP